MLSLSCDLQYQIQLCRFTVIYKSSPVASWDSKLSIVCTFYQLFYVYCEFRHTFCIVGKYAILNAAQA